jgi:hypothetical protein
MLTTLSSPQVQCNHYAKTHIKNSFCSDDLVDLGVDYLVAYPALVGTGICVAVLLLLAFAFICREGEEPRQEDEEEQDEEEEEMEKKESKKDT